MQKAEDLSEEFYASIHRWSRQQIGVAGLRSWNTSAYSHVGEVEHQGCRGCRPWKVQLGGPSEEMEGAERMGEKCFMASQENAILYALRSEQSSTAR